MSGDISQGSTPLPSYPNTYRYSTEDLLLGSQCEFYPGRIEPRGPHKLQDRLDMPHRIDPRGPPGLGPPGLPDRFSPHQLGPERMSGRSTRETSLNLSTDRSTIMDYRTVMGELSDSKF